MPTPLVSVVLTTYNQAQWLAQAVDSVVAQTFQDWELWLIDNGSTDRTPEIAEPYGADPRIHIIRHERNQPHTRICNAAFRQARGRYVSLLYGDDYYLPLKLERQVAVFAGLPEAFGVVYASGYRLMQDGELRLLPCGSFRGEILEALLTHPQFFQPIAPLIRRECLLRYPFNERLFIEGEGIHNRIAMRYHYAPLAEPLVVMRDHENNLGKEIGPNLERCRIIYDDLFAHPDFPPRLHYLQGRALGATYRMAGWETLRRERDYAQARRWLKQAVQYDRSLLRDFRVLVGLLLTCLPRMLSEWANNLLDSFFGVPIPPVKVPLAPVIAMPEASQQTSIAESRHRDRYGHAKGRVGL